jgi:hypothetical protein
MEWSIVFHLHFLGSLWGAGGEGGGTYSGNSSFQIQIALIAKSGWVLAFRQILYQPPKQFSKFLKFKILAKTTSYPFMSKIHTKNRQIKEHPFDFLTCRNPVLEPILLSICLFLCLNKFQSEVCNLINVYIKLIGKEFFKFCFDAKC